MQEATQVPLNFRSTKELLSMARLSCFPADFDVEDAAIALGTNKRGAELALGDLEQKGFIRKMCGSLYCMPEITKSLPAVKIHREEKNAAAVRYVMHWSGRLREWDAD